MGRPKLLINLEKLRRNAEVLIEKSQGFGMEISAVTKMTCGDVNIAQALLSGGIKILADSRLDNLKRLKELECKKWLIRSPAPDETDDVVELADVSLNSELAVIRKLSESAARAGKIHDIILMVDLGDLREGIFDETELLRTAECCKELPNLRLLGLGTNMMCYGCVLPDPANMHRLAELAERIEEHSRLKLSVISGGNSSLWQLACKGGADGRINNIRLGEPILFGRERAGYSQIPGCCDDAIMLEAQVIEAKRKPSVPVGVRGVDSRGVRPCFEDEGWQNRAVLNIGRQDVDIDLIFPTDDRLKVLGGSCDHLIVRAGQGLRLAPGDTVRFKLNYLSAMRLFTSGFVDRVYEDREVLC